MMTTARYPEHILAAMTGAELVIEIRSLNRFVDGLAPMPQGMNKVKVCNDIAALESALATAR